MSENRRHKTKTFTLERGVVVRMQIEPELEQAIELVAKIDNMKQGALVKLALQDAEALNSRVGAVRKHVLTRMMELLQP